MTVTDVLVFALVVGILLWLVLVQFAEQTGRLIERPEQERRRSHGDR